MLYRKESEKEDNITRYIDSAYGCISLRLYFFLDFKIRRLANNCILYIYIEPAI